MQLLDRRNFLQLTAAAGAAGFLAQDFARAASGRAEVFTSDDAGLLVDSTVILGEKSAVVVDAQFTAANAKALVDMIAATGRSVETIFITHYHPDHVFGLAMLMERFPNAKPVAHKSVQALVGQTLQPIFDRITSGAPAGLFADRVIVPEALDADHFILEGERIEVLDPMHGDTDLITPLYIPALKTLITSDVAYADTHLWMEENTKPEQVAAWRESISQLEAMGAQTVIPGHRKADSPLDATVFMATKSYLDHWEAALAKSKNADELRAALLEGKANLGFEFAVERAVSAVHPS